jgi:hypothetical protein
MDSGDSGENGVRAEDGSAQVAVLLCRQLLGGRGRMAEQSPTKGSRVEEGNVNARTIQYTPTPTRVLSVAYVLELRRLIREDAYRSEAVADEIARRIFDAGDI